MRQWAFLLLGLNGSLLSVGCRREPAPTGPTAGVGFETGTVHIISRTDSLVLQVGIAETEQQHRTGLSRRSELPDSAGLIFLFEKEQPRGRAFWMYHTSVPLSIAFLDSERVIREIREMAPCRSRIAFFCRRYAAGVPFRAALEMNRGFFARHGLEVGDRVILVRSR